MEREVILGSREGVFPSEGTVRITDLMQADEIERRLCETFCGGISVNPLAAGYAISSVFEDNSGDRLSFYLMPGSDDQYAITDDGSYLAELIARDIPIQVGQRGQMLEAILHKAGAYWDRDTFEIKTQEFPKQDIPNRLIEFLSGLIRVRDLELLIVEMEEAA